jgi:hypothetical protein
MQGKYLGTERGKRIVRFVEEARVWWEWGVCGVTHHDQESSNNKISRQFAYEAIYGDIPLLPWTQY